MAEEQGGWTIDEYTTEGGESPVRAFISGLSGRDEVEAVALIKLLEERGNTLRPPHSKPLGAGLFELRGNQVRIFYVFRPGRRVTLLHGILKKQDEIPLKEMRHVRRLQQAVLATDRKEAKR